MSSSSPSARSSSPEGFGGGDGSGEEEEFDPGPSSSSSRSRMKAANGVWPEPFVEALAFQVAIDASRSFGRLAAGAALANMFQVCSTWRAVSRSDLLWESLTGRVWKRRRGIQHNTWREEYIYWHQTANNFRVGRYIYTNLRFDPPPTDNDVNGLRCCRLVLSDHHLAAGFSDGSVRLFHIPSRFHLSTFRPHYRDRLGRFSSAVSGIILSDTRLVFASQDGDIHVVVIGNPGLPRRAHLGDVVNDGALVDFSGCHQWWVGLYAGVPGRAFHVWDGESEELVFVGGTLTDPEAVMGWHLLTELTAPVGRVRVTSQETVVACTSLRLIVFDLRNQGFIIGEEEFPGGLMVGSLDVDNESFMVAEDRGVASIRRAEDLGETCRLNVRSGGSGVVVACMNGGYVLMCAGGVIRVFEREGGRYVYSVRERLGDLHVIVGDDRHVAACNNDDAIIHLWDFGAQ
ncbi:PREDICTED: transcriptional regulator STERILE APETALA-like [Ipomoea nil]|uniref:transcriptional regulator STERILE APETALA-like n=1 Tax=Ipomoea nil TaxID=35883 RepID=UPI0009018E74|nr:PREDICTED: transcriptional regulator STERILE APETALA-like [Ipomoea nil]